MQCFADVFSARAATDREVCTLELLILCQLPLLQKIVLSVMTAGTMYTRLNGEYPTTVPLLPMAGKPELPAPSAITEQDLLNTLKTENSLLHKIFLKLLK